MSAALLATVLAVASVTCTRPVGGVLSTGWEVRLASSDLVVEGVNGILAVWHLPTGGLVRVPMWPLLGALLLYPTIALIRGPLRRSRRLKTGQCLRCGYRLRGWRGDAKRCPECGTPF